MLRLFERENACAGLLGLLALPSSVMLGH